MSFYVDFALANYREPTFQNPLGEAIADYLAGKDHELERDLISDPYAVRLRRGMNRVQKRIPGLKFFPKPSAKDNRVAV